MDLLISILVFIALSSAFVFANLTMGSLIRPKLPNAQKQTIYECGEPTFGSSWVQFDLRFYIIALVFLIFDVEVALFYPWAVAWGEARQLAIQAGLSSTFAFRAPALIDLLVFLGVLLVGFAYLWRFGYLDFVRSVASTHQTAPEQSSPTEPASMHQPLPARPAEMAGESSTPSR